MTPRSLNLRLIKQVRRSKPRSNNGGYFVRILTVDEGEDYRDRYLQSICQRTTVLKFEVAIGL